MYNFTGYLMSAYESVMWYLDVPALASATAAFFTWCIYFRFLLLPIILLKLIKCFLWPHFVTRNVEGAAKLSLPPGGYGWPLIGETLDFLVDGRKYYRSRIAKHGLIFSSHLITQPYVVVAGPELVKEVLYSGEHLVKPNPMPGCRYLLGEGAMSSSDQEQHRLRQRIMRRKFTETSLNDFVPEIQRIVRHFLNKWCQTDTIMGVTECKSLTFMVVSEVLFGLRLCDDDITEIEKHFVFFIENFFCFPFDCPGFVFGKTMKARQSMIDVIKRHLTRNGTPDSFMDLVQHASTSHVSGSESIPEEHAQSLFIESLFGSNETTASTLCALLIRLTHNPQVVHEVREEVSRHMAATHAAGGSTETLSYNDLKQLVYVNDVLKEVLRLDPPVAGGFRKAAKSFELGGYLVPEGWGIMYCITDTHEQSSLFNAESRLDFDPKRWSKLREQTGTVAHNLFSSDEAVGGGDTKKAEDTAQKSAQPQHPERHHYLPFGGGSRHCIGQQFARLFCNILIVELCCNSTWIMQNPHPKIKSEPLPFPADGMPLRFRHRASPEE